MLDKELRRIESITSGGTECAIDLVLVGHIGLAANQTVSGAAVSAGGSGYAVAVGASVVFAGHVGLVAQVGEDFDVALLQQLGLNLEGVAVLRGASAKFFISQFSDGTRSFRSKLGVAASVRVDSFPMSYFPAKHVHLGTAPPEQQLFWLRFLRDRGCHAQISADVFEHFVAAEPGASREVCDLADLLFMNEMEYDILYGEGSNLKTPVIVKRGAGGADYLADGMVHHVPVPPASLVDSTGAGEILAGVFLALRAHGLLEIPALTYAVQIATNSVKEFGVDGPHVMQALAAAREEIRHALHA